MVIVIIKMTALPNKKLELKQSLMALIKPTRNEKGCLRHQVLQDLENDNDIDIIQLWQTQANMEAYLRSDLFKILMGTKYLLSRPSEFTVNEVTPLSGWEAAEAMRG